MWWPEALSHNPLTFKKGDMKNHQKRYGRIYCLQKMPLGDLWPPIKCASSKPFHTKQKRSLSSPSDLSYPEPPTPLKSYFIGTMQVVGVKC